MKKYTLFETLRTIKQGKEYLFLNLHKDRLIASLKKMKNPIDKAGVDLVMKQLQSLLPFKTEKRIHIVVSPEGYIWFKVKSLKSLPIVCYEKGVEVVDILFERSKNQFKYQTETYLKYASQEDENWTETLFIDKKGYLREGNITNIFCLIEGKWVTPPLEQCFPGIMRSKLIKVLKADQRKITKKEAQCATSLLLTNSVKGVIPARRWGNMPYKVDNGLIEKLNENLNI